MIASRIAIAAIAASLAFSGCAKKDTQLEGTRLDLRNNAEAGITDAEAATVADSNQKVFALALPATVSNANWTHKNGSASHQINHPSFSTAPRLRWSRDIGSGNSKRLRLSSDPIVANGKVFVLDSAGVVSAFTPTGGLVWRKSLKPASDLKESIPGGGLAFGSDSLVATTGYGEVLAMEPSTGDIRWRQKVPAGLSSAPIVIGDLTIALANNNETFAIRLDNGRIQWQNQGPAAGPGLLGGGTPAQAGGLAILPYSTAEVVAFVPKNGLTAWSQKLSGRRLGVARSFVTAVSGDPVTFGDLVIFGTQSGRLTAVDRLSGERKWTVREGAVGPVWPVDDALFLLTDELKLKRLDAETGAMIWAKDLPTFKNTKKLKGAYAHYGPVLAGGSLWVAGSDAFLRRFDPRTGAELDQIAIPNGAASQPAVAAGVMYILSGSGQLHAFQ